MANFHAIMVDECGDEFGVTIEAATHDEAYDKLRDNYPESSVMSVQTPREAAEIEAARYRRLAMEMDGHDDWDGYEYDEDEDEDEDDEDEDE